MREKVLELLGGRVGQVRFAEVARVASEPFGAGRIETLEFVTQEGVRVPARFLWPGGEGPVPGVLYCHAHGNRYDIGMAELTQGRDALMGPYAEDLAQAGYAVLCLESPCFGSRADPGEQAAAKAHLWRGTTLFGEMLAEQVAGVGYLAGRGDVDAGRVAVMGISMGGTLAWWLGALDARLRAVVSMCCFADLGCLVEEGAHDGHGIYMTVPGLLTHVPTGRLAGLAAPAPQLHCVGLRDWSTPERCFGIARRELEAAYAAMGAEGALEFHVEAQLGHAESPAMRRRVLSFLARHLRG